jgi:TPP-dependent pyruvate/acetoin dehydrogenase alpha subunit
LIARDKRIEDETLAAVQFAENSPEPPPEALFQHIYVDAKVEES